MTERTKSIIACVVLLAIAFGSYEILDHRAGPPRDEAAQKKNAPTQS
jgi:hypothetical protein